MSSVYVRDAEVVLLAHRVLGPGAAADLPMGAVDVYAVYVPFGDDATAGSLRHVHRRLRGPAEHALPDCRENAYAVLARADHAEAASTDSPTVKPRALHPLWLGPQVRMAAGCRAAGARRIVAACGSRGG